MKLGERVNELVKEGKTYDLLYDNKLVCNITLEQGNIMNKQLAFEIINDILAQQGIKARKYVMKCTFIEIN